MVDLTGVTGLDHQADPGTGLGPHQMVVDGSHQQQRGNGGEICRRVPVGKHDDVGAVHDGSTHLDPDLVDGRPQGRSPAVGLEQAIDGEGSEPRGAPVFVDVEQLGQVVVVDDRHGQDDLVTRGRGRLQEIRLGTKGGQQRGDQLFADGIEWWVGDLGEQLGEVVVDQARPLRQHGDGRVRAHRPERLHASAGHGGKDQPELFVGVAEQLLAADDRGVLGGEHRPGRQIVEIDLAGLEPLGVGMLGGQFGLELVVIDDPTGGRVDQEHPTGLQAALAHHLGRWDVEDAYLAGQYHQVVIGHPVAARAQPIAVQDGTDHGAVGEGHGGGSVPWLHQRRVIAVEGSAGRVHGPMVLPRFRDHHQHGMVDGTAAEVEQFQDLVERG